MTGWSIGGLSTYMGLPKMIRRKQRATLQGVALCVLLLCCLPLAAQKPEGYCDPHYFIAQREGTEALVRDFFADIGTAADTIYVVMYSPGFSPRLENPLLFFHDGIKAFDADADVVVLSVGCSCDVAEKYNKRKGYEADCFICDPAGKYLEFLSVNSAGLMGSYVLKVARNSGRVIYGGCMSDVGAGFFKSLVSTTQPYPFHTYCADVVGSEFPLPDDLERASLSYVTAEIVADDSLFAIGTVQELPVMSDGLLVFADDYNQVFSCFRRSFSEKYEKIGEIAPDEDESFVYMNVPDIYRDLLVSQGFCYWIPLGATVLPGGDVGCVYDFPLVYEEEDGSFAFFNQPAMIVRDGRTLEAKRMVGLSDDFFNDLDEYFYDISKFNVIDSTTMMLGLRVNSWPIDYYEDYNGDPRHDSFLDAFYDNDNPTVQLVDMVSGKQLRKFGALDAVAGETKTSYYFTDLVAGVHDGEVAYCDNPSGVVKIADTATPWEVKLTYKAFDLDPERKSAMDKSKFYTLEYANDYLPYFCRRVKCLRLTDDRIHLLISVAYSIQSNFDEAVYEYRVIDRRSSEVETSFRVDKQFDDETVLAAGLSSDDEPVLFYLSERDGRYYMTEVKEK